MPTCLAFKSVILIAGRIYLDLHKPSRNSLPLSPETPTRPPMYSARAPTYSVPSYVALVFLPVCLFRPLPVSLRLATLSPFSGILNRRMLQLLRRPASVPFPSLASRPPSPPSFRLVRSLSVSSLVHICPTEKE